MFAQLDTKTVYTFMDSMITIEDYVKRGKTLGYSHLGVMDCNNLYAAYSFLEACYREGVTPILGCELDVTVTELVSTLKIQVVALNTYGYQNLMKLVTLQQTDGLHLTDLAKFQEGLAFILPYSDMMQEVELGVDYFIGVKADTPVQDFNHPILPLYTVRLFEEQERTALQVLQAIKKNCPRDQVVPPIGQTLLDPVALETLFSERFPQAVTALTDLVGSVSYQLDQRLKLPRFSSDRPAVAELREKAELGLAEKGLNTPLYHGRLEKELAVIHQMGFDDYFLIVWDLLAYGRREGFYMGMGRGSAVGSLVAYALNITGIDPVKHQLLFERFLNAERFSLPDIDIDIPDVHRRDFLHYVSNKYGPYHTAQIVTFSTFGAKQAIRDVLKRFKLSEYEVAQLTKKISFKDNLQSAYDSNASFRQLITSKAIYQEAFAIAQQIEGHPRQTSIHAAGVVMSDQVLTQTIPLKAGAEMLVTQYDAHAVEANGLLKMDFLGLRNLTLIQKMAETVRTRLNQTVDIAAIDLEDKDTLNLFAAGQTKGIFQFEQPGAIQLLKRVQPSCFEDLVATTSLNRPGASDYADNFVRRKQGKERIDFVDPHLSPILQSTYGIMLYQEQVMQIAQVYAGFTLGKADLLRRAMSKKNAAEMQAMEVAFVEGAVALGHEEAKARTIFAIMAKFAGYGFNRSHAYAYTALAFQMAYFKSHYPAIFFEILLNESTGDYLTDALQSGFKPAQLDIRSASYKDRIQGEEIHIGLKHLREVPKDFLFWMLEVRRDQNFASFEDFVRRLPQKYHKTEILSPLIRVGFFDSLSSNRRRLLENLENLFQHAKEGLLFLTTSEGLGFDWIEVEDFTDTEKFKMEQDLLGIGLSPHPLLALQKEYQQEFVAVSDVLESQTVRILVQIQSLKGIRTKKTGQQMAFLQVTDTRTNLDATVFPEVFKKYKCLLTTAALVFLTGKIQERDGNLQLVVDTVETTSRERFWIQLKNEDLDYEIAQILKKFPGNIPVLVHYQNQNKTVQVQQLFVEKTKELQDELAELTVKTVFR